MEAYNGFILLLGVLLVLAILCLVRFPSTPRYKDYH